MRFVLASILFVLMITSCQAVSLSLYPGEVSSGEVFFQDDFSDPASGWQRIPEGSEGVLDYEEGAYRILVNESYQMLWSSPGLRFDDVRIEVDVGNLNEPKDDDFGVICRAKDWANFYFLVISSDGYYGIGKVKNSVQRLIGMQAMLPSEDIARGRAINHLRADCIGDALSLYVNGVLLKTVRDPDYRTGDVGLLAGTFEEPGTEVFFDRFTVLKP
jgi:hypothetical protein